MPNRFFSSLEFKQTLIYSLRCCFFVFLLTILSYCQSKEKEGVIIKARPELTTQSLDSVTFFGWIRDIKIFGDKIYLADNTRNLIHVLTLELKYVESIGLDENSPVSFKGIQNIAVTDSAIFVNDLTGGKIVEFRNNQFIRTHKIPLGMGDFSAVGTKFFVNPVDYSTELALAYDARNQEILSRFGSVPPDIPGHPYYHILSSSRFRVAVPRENSAIIRIYDTSENLVSETNLAESTLLEGWVEGLSIESRIRANPTFSQVIFRDAALVEDRLFLMTPEQTIHEVREPIYIYEFAIREDGSLQEERRIQIADSSQGSFYCFDISILHNIMVFYDPVEGSVVTYSFD
jgi:hypothetical protein